MSERHWTYAQITARSEERLTAFIALAKEAAGEEDGYDKALRWAMKAEGVFAAWLAVVGGARLDVDAQRMISHLNCVRPHLE